MGKKNLEGVDALFGKMDNKTKSIEKIITDNCSGEIKEELVTKTFRIFPSVHKALKQRAVFEDKKDWEVLCDALTEYLKEEIK